MALLEVRKSRVYGRGCFTLEPVRKRQKIAAYAGELLRGGKKIDARIWKQTKEGVVKVIRMGDEVAIDGAVGGDATAFINHSCDPNAFMQCVPGDKVVFFARRDIRAGEEITMDYRDPNHPEVCRCGASNCRSKQKPE